MDQISERRAKYFIEVVIKQRNIPSHKHVFIVDRLEKVFAVRRHRVWLLNLQDCWNGIFWFKAKNIATFLGYEIPKKELLDHLGPKCHTSWAEIKGDVRNILKTPSNWQQYWYYIYFGTRSLRSIECRHDLQVLNNEDDKCKSILSQARTSHAALIRAQKSRFYTKIYWKNSVSKRTERSQSRQRIASTKVVYIKV